MGEIANYILIASAVISFATALIIAKYRALLTSRFQRTFLETVASLDVNQIVPPETSFAKHPRRVVFNDVTGGNPPGVYQRWMIANPLVWLMFYYVFTACTVDEELRRFGQLYSAKLTRSEATYHTFHTKVLLQVAGRLENLTFAYTVQGKTYFVQMKDSGNLERYPEGKSFPIWALPSKPSIHEPIGEKLGAKQIADLYAAALCAVLNLALEFVIWFQPLRHRRLAEIGTPVPVRIKSLSYKQSAPANTAPSQLTAIVELSKDGQLTKKEFNINAPEYLQLEEGSTELVLFDPWIKPNMVFYRFCKYRVTD